MKFVSQKVEENVAIVTLDCQEKNALTDPFVQELRETIAAVEKDKAIKSLVITGGHEKYFCTGLDLDWMTKQQYEDVIKFLLNVNQLLKQTAMFGKPLIGAINGHAFAAGGMLALAHDFRVMRADRGFFCLPEVDIQLPLQPGMTALIKSRLSPAAARDAILTGARIGGAEAVQRGIVDDAVAMEDVLPRAVARAAGLAGKDRAIYGTLKRGLYADVRVALTGGVA